MNSDNDVLVIVGTVIVWALLLFTFTGNLILRTWLSVLEGFGV